MSKREEKVAKELRAKGVRATSQRIALLTALYAASTPQSAEALAQARKGELDLATVYRALQEFERLGLVRRVQMKAGSLYEVVGTHHHHLICRSCGLIEDVEVCLPRSVRAKLTESSNRFRSVDDHALEYFGICTSCAV